MAWARAGSQSLGREQAGILVGSHEDRVGHTVGVEGTIGMERIPLYEPSALPCAAQARAAQGQHVHTWG